MLVRITLTFRDDGDPVVGEPVVDLREVAPARAINGHVMPPKPRLVFQQRPVPALLDLAAVRMKP